MENVANQFLVPSEFAAIARRSLVQTYRDIKSGKVPSIKIGNKILIPSSYIQSLTDAALEKTEGVSHA